jgi:hypothetical protein
LACEVFENAKARIEETGYDNWNGGTYLSTLFLDLPLKVFALIKPDVSRRGEPEPAPTNGGGGADAQAPLGKLVDVLKASHNPPSRHDVPRFPDGLERRGL